MLSKQASSPRAPAQRQAEAGCRATARGVQGGKRGEGLRGERGGGVEREGNDHLDENRCHDHDDSGISQDIRVWGYPRISQDDIFHPGISQDILGYPESRNPLANPSPIMSDYVR